MNRALSDVENYAMHVLCSLEQTRSAPSGGLATTNSGACPADRPLRGVQKLIDE
ncbi:hypothetical protein H3146_08225 [Streptomyces sp. OF3]|uniref:Uncharacterized protein n=1 Tax=Streptomyces alkaliterrae TaxID=2213162 RepID=A0A7W3WJA9_9ACTN|nr:hypothetical protein [Streptomyces alkaliterrae]MBB1253357.1 hypothetical protein [Streptomyces alkaliterrae]